MELKNLSECYERLQDNESKKIFDLRLNYAFDKNRDKFLTGILNLEKHWRVIESDDFRKLYKGQKIVIWGGNIEGRFTEKIINDSGCSVWGYCDNDPSKWGSYNGDKRIFSPKELIKSGEEFFYIPASTLHGNEIYGQIVSQKMAIRENIFLPTYGAMYAICGNQYFDCPDITLQDNEIFVDMGMYDGLTSLYVAKHCNYKRIVGFEASNLTVEKCREKLKNYEHIDIYQYAAWCKHEWLQFELADAGSYVTKNGLETVEAESLDNVLNGGEVTFIKMDIEGAEEQALIGAWNSIKKYKPKLAISVYHKPEDIIVLPTLILRIRNDYKFYLRHYASRMEETILYAV